RFLMVTLALALLLLTSAYMVELSAVMRNVTLPERGDLDSNPFLRNVWFLHETSYALTSLIMFCLTIERLYACIRAEEYAKNRKFSFLIVVAVLLSVAGSVTFGYFIHFRDIHIPTTSIINSFELCALFLSLFTLYWSRRKYRSMILSNLNCRYQIYEVINLTKCIIPAIIMGVIFKLTAMIFVWRMIIMDTDPLFFAEIVSAYGLIFPWIVMTRHHRMRSHLIHILSCGEVYSDASARDARKKADRLTRSMTQDEYFEML
ncbi:hypothetical protein PENTCL1PPCAC_28383, partial [Pristionchus entomophagus]